MSEAVQYRYKYLRITNASLLEWIKKSLELPEDIKVVKVVAGPREDEFRVVIGSQEFEPEPIGKIPPLMPEFRKR